MVFIVRETVHVLTVFHRNVAALAGSWTASACPYDIVSIGTIAPTLAGVTTSVIVTGQLVIGRTLAIVACQSVLAVFIVCAIPAFLSPFLTDVGFVAKQTRNTCAAQHNVVTNLTFLWALWRTHSGLLIRTISPSTLFLFSTVHTSLLNFGCTKVSWFFIHTSLSVLAEEIDATLGQLITLDTSIILGQRPTASRINVARSTICTLHVSFTLCDVM